jgi:hypothetical protein
VVWNKCGWWIYLRGCDGEMTACQALMIGSYGYLRSTAFRNSARRYAEQLRILYDTIDAMLLYNSCLRENLGKCHTRANYTYSEMTLIPVLSDCVRNIPHLQLFPFRVVVYLLNHTLSSIMISL